MIGSCIGRSGIVFSTSIGARLGRPDHWNYDWSSLAHANTGMRTYPCIEGVICQQVENVFGSIPEGRPFPDFLFWQQFELNGAGETNFFTAAFRKDPTVGVHPS